MSLLVSREILERIRDELSRTVDSFLLISAYCKLPLVEFFDSCILNPNVEKKSVVRFRPGDILGRASDLEIYPYCKRHGWKLYFRLALHAKTYIFDNVRCIVGSANATSSGLSVIGTRNYEISAACLLEDKDIKTLELLLLGAVEMNDEIYDLMNIALFNQTSNTSNFSWPKLITSLFVPDYSLLFSEDFPSLPHPKNLSADDLAFLDLPASATTEMIRYAFENSKCFCWLAALIKSQTSQEMYFGAITAALHNTLLNEPKPYRKEIKELLNNLLNWIVDLDILEIQVDRPSYSQRVRYLQKTTKSTCPNHCVRESISLRSMF